MRFIRGMRLIPGAHGPIEDANGFPESLREVRVPWNIFRHRFKFDPLGLFPGRAPDQFGGFATG